MSKYKNLFNIKNKVSIIIGATRGIGKEIFDGFTELGSLTYGVGRSKIKKRNFFKSDINDEISIEKFLKEFIENITELIYLLIVLPLPQQKRVIIKRILK